MHSSISTGPAPVVVPSVVNQTQAAATSALTGAGLTVGTITKSSSATVPSGSVISQTPIAGTSVAAGSAVALVISTGPAPVVGAERGEPDAGGRDQRAHRCGPDGRDHHQSSSATVPAGR